MQWLLADPARRPGPPAARGEPGLLPAVTLWAIAMTGLALLAQPRDSARNNWIGIHAIEGAEFFERFADRQSCLDGMGEESFTCVPRNGRDANAAQAATADVAAATRKTRK